MKPLPLHEWAERFTSELAMVVGALVEGSASAVPYTEAPGSGWTVSLIAGHGAHGTLAVHFDRKGAEAFCKRVMGLEVEPQEPAVIDTLKEICAQAAGSMVQRSPLEGTTLVIDSVVKSDGAGDDVVLIAVESEGAEPLRLALSGTLGLAMSAPPQSDDLGRNPKLDVILDIDLPLMIRFGRTEMSLRLLTALGPGSVIDLGRSPDDPVDVLVSNQVVARGEVVIVGGNYGVRITDVVNAAARTRAMEVESQ